MSGRWFTGLTLATCVLLALFALWQRSLDTARIRQFWGPQAASLIQHAKLVEIKGPRAAASTDPTLAAEPWHDFSHAPGLVHLRATLVDDHYFQWPATATLPNGVTNPGAGRYLLKFSDHDHSIELALALPEGWITHLATGRSVKLIPASAQAIAAYLASEGKQATADSGS